jgi:hypothetical protein
MKEANSEEVYSKGAKADHGAPINANAGLFGSKITRNFSTSLTSLFPKAYHKVKYH